MTHLDTSSMTELQQLYIQQIEHEKQMTEFGKIRYDQRRLKNIKRETESDTLYGTTIISHYTVPLAEAIAAVIAEAAAGKAGRKNRAVEAVKGLDPRVTAMLTLKSILNTLSTRKPLQHVMLNIGSLIEDEIRFKEVKEADKAEYKYMIEEAAKRTSYHHKQYYMVRASSRKGFEWAGWSNIDKLHIGQKMLDLLMGVSNLVEVITQTVGKNLTYKYLKPTQETLEWMEKRNAVGCYLSPKYEPMTTHFVRGYMTKYRSPLGHLR